MTDPFGITEEPQIDVEAYGRSAAESVYSSIQNAVNATARSRQAQRRVIGVSNLGHCRRFLQYMILDEPESDERDKTPAFIGTVLGDAVEKQIKEDHPDWIIQEELIFPLPSGGNVKGHSDIIIPASAAGTLEEWQASQEEGYDGPPVYLQGVWDLKTKAELDTIKRYGPSQQQVWQIHAYAKAAIEKGLLDPEQPILLGDVYFDRSGRDVVPHGVFHVYSEAVILAIDEWVGDVSYAVLNGEDAPQDKPVEWCANWCELFTTCRGAETTAEGLITDEEIVNAVNLYGEGAALEKEGKRLKDRAKENLDGVEGSTGEWTIKRVHVNATEIAAYTRAGYDKISISKVPKSKKKEANK